MTHHMTEGVGLDWMRGAAIAFLIRDPRSVAASYAAKREDITDIGNARQAEILDIVADMQGTLPPVVDAADVHAASEAVSCWPWLKHDLWSSPRHADQIANASEYESSAMASGFSIGLPKIPFEAAPLGGGLTELPSVNGR